MMRNLLLVGVMAPVSSLAGIHNVRSGSQIQEGIGTQVTFQVRGESEPIFDLKVRLSISHPRISDLNVTLEAVNEQLVLNLTPVGGSSNFQDTLFEVSGSGVIGTNGFNEAPFRAPEYGGVSYVPQDGPLALTRFYGDFANRDWNLYIYDSFEGATGRLHKAGEQADWGTAIGTQLIINTVPEPHGFVALGLATLAVVRRMSRR